MNIRIKGAYVLNAAMDDAAIGDLYIADGAIVGVGAAPAGFAAGRVIHAAGKLAMPGLVNAHTHAYMSVFRNYADDLAFDDWLFGKILPAEDRLTGDDAYWCNLLSCLEMIRTGTTTFADMHMFAGQSVRAAKESGLRAVIARGLVGEGPNDEAAQTRLAQAFAEMDEARGCGRITFMLAPHAIYTCGEALLRHIAELAGQKGLGLHIHVAESAKEFDDCVEQHGLSPVGYLDSIGLFAIPTLAAHCVQLSAEDIEILARNGVHVATNPASNMKLGNGFAPVPALLEAGVNVCAGTDGASSNNVLNMFRELSLLSLAHKGVSREAQCLPAPATLRCGTQNGATALGLGAVTGTLEVGKRADIVLVDLNRPWLRPLNNPAASLIYAATGAEVDTVLVDGEIIMENGRVLTLDEERICAEMERIREKVLR